MLEAGITPSAELMPPQEPDGEVKAYQQMHQFLELPGPFTTVHAANDKSAMGAYQAIADVGLRIPDNIPMA